LPEYRRILEFENELEARLLEAELIEREIPHAIRSNYDFAYDGIFQIQHGWGYLEAPEEYVEKIKEIYNDLRESDD